MKLLVLGMAAVALGACSTPPQQSTVPMDMQAVYEYQSRIATTKTGRKTAQPNDEPMNQSDRYGKERYTRSFPAIHPHIGVGYHHGWGRYHHHW